MKPIFLALILSFLSNPAIAQDISVKMSELGIGGYIVLNAGGKTYTHVIRGKRNGLYVWDAIPGKDPNRKKGASRTLKDAKGQTVKWTLPDGKIVRFKPHNCQRTVGECRFEEIGPDYKTRMLRINTPVKGGLEFKQYALKRDGSRQFIRSGSVKLDRMGMIKTGTQKELGTRQIKFKQIGASYQ